MASSTSAAADTPGEADLQAIRELVVAYESAWNVGDMDAMGRLYAPGVRWVNVKGMHWQGFEAVDRAHRVYMDLMFRGVRQDLQEIESVAQVAAGVTVVVARWQVGAYTSPGGHAIPPHRTRMTLVLGKAEGRWRILHGANIVIDEQAAAFDPIQARPPG